MNEPKKKIKVAWFCDDIDRKTKAQATYSKKLISQLVKKYGEQVDLTLVYRQGKCRQPECALAKSLEIKTFKLPFFSGLISWLWFFLTVKEYFDIFQSPRHNLYPGFFIAKLRGRIKHFVVTLHGAPDRLTPRQFRKAGFWWNLHIKYLAKFFVDKFLAVSETGRKQIINYYKISPKKVDYFYISCGDEFKQLNEEEVPGNKLALERKYNFKFPCIVQVGRFDPHKNVHRLVEAFAKLKKEKKIEHSLVLVGGRHLENYSRKVEKIIKENNLTDEVIITKDIEASDMPSIYGLAEVVVNVSLNEGFGLPLVEAMKVGSAQVVSEIPAFKEVAGSAVKFVNPLKIDEIAEGIYQLLLNKELKNQLINKGLSRAQIFSWGVAAERLIQIYCSIL